MLNAARPDLTAELFELSGPSERPQVIRIRADLTDYVNGYAEPLIASPARAGG